MKPSPLVKAVLISLLVFAIFAGLYFAKPFLVPFTLAAILSMLFLPISRKLERRGVHKGVAALACILILLSVFAGIVGLVSWQVSNLMDDKAKLERQINKTVRTVQSTIDKKLGVPPKQQEEIINQQQDTANGLGGTILAAFTGILVDAIIVLVYIFFFMLSRQHIKKGLLLMVPAERKKKTECVINDTANVAQKYLTGLGLMIFCLWVMYGIGFSIVGVKNAVFFAVLCRLLEIVPFIGNLLGTFMTLLMALAQGGSLTMVIGIVVVYALVQFIQGNVLEPLIVGSQVNVNALATIIVLVIGDLLWGIPGIVLAIPLLGITKVLCDNIEGLKPIGFLIGQERPEEKKESLSTKMKELFKKKNSK